MNASLRQSDLSGKTAGIAYLPGYHKDVRDSFQELMELLLRNPRQKPEGLEDLIALRQLLDRQD